MGGVHLGGGGLDLGYASLRVRHGGRGGKGRERTGLGVSVSSVGGKVSIVFMVLIMRRIFEMVGHGWVERGMLVTCGYG